MTAVSTGDDTDPWCLPPRELAAGLTLRGRQSELSDNERWLLAVSLGAIGRYRDALALLDWPDVAGDDPCQSQWLSTAASLHRQVGRHAEARELDTRALVRATSDHDRCDALVGLAADAVGLADADSANEHWSMAVDHAGVDWRRRTRCAWVRAEIDLLAGNPRRAVESAREALEHSVHARAPRHQAKSELVLGVALMTADDPTAMRHLMTALTMSRTLGIWTLVWPSATVLAVVDPLRADEWRREARLVTTTLEFCLPTPWRRDWNDVHRHAD